MSAKLGGEIVTDADGFTRCGHEREYCHECYCDHRLYNDLQRKENKLGRPLTESENLEIHIKHELLHNNEVRDMFRARQPGAQGPLVLGSEEHN